MPRWLRITEILIAGAVGWQGATLGYSKGVTMLAFFAVFFVIETAWYVYRRHRGIPDA